MKLSEYLKTHGYYGRGCRINDKVGTIYGKDSEGDLVPLTNTFAGIDINKLNYKIKTPILNSEVLEVREGITTNFVVDFTVEKVFYKSSVVILTNEGKLITSSVSHDHRGHESCKYR